MPRKLINQIDWNCPNQTAAIYGGELSRNFSIYHELMLRKVREILLVATPYDAYVLEEDGSLASRIIHEYHGLNLSAPPRIRRVSSAKEAIRHLKKNQYDLVITMPYVSDTDACSLGRSIKKINPNVPVILLTYNIHDLHPLSRKQTDGCIDDVYFWTGDSELLLAIIKNVEDHLNADRDTRAAKVRILIFVEDSPAYRSGILPLIYKEVVRQTQAVFLDSLNEDHRLLKMRARPKILTAENYEEAMHLYRRYRPYVFGILSDTRFPRKNKLDQEAGFRLLRHARKQTPDLSLLLLSSESVNKSKAASVPAAFIDKNSPDLLQRIEDFFLNSLGFGDFVFKLPDGTEVGSASNFHTFEDQICKVPDESLYYHASRNHFSNWFMARSEIGIASHMAALTVSDFADLNELRDFLKKAIHLLRVWRQKGVITRFDRNDFDPNITEFVKIGRGSTGGKARGLAFISSLIAADRHLCRDYPEISLKVPFTCAIAEKAFDEFIEQNKLYYVSGGKDAIIAKRFLEASLPSWLRHELEAFLKIIRFPLAIRSSSLLEDAHFRPYAGLYKTYMLPNCHPDIGERLRQLEQAIKLVYASTFFQGPRSYSRTVGQGRKDSMAVMIQQLAGQQFGNWFYPALSGVAQSQNFYPISHMKQEDGIASIALGFGKTVVEGEKCLHFSPVHPEILPQFSSVDDILKNAQQTFYALNLENCPTADISRHSNLSKRNIQDAVLEEPVQALTSTYEPEEHRIRDYGGPGAKVATFAQILKHKAYAMPEMIEDLLAMGKEAMGGPIEIEFALTLPHDETPAEFHFLQIRPMASSSERFEVNISRDEMCSAVFKSNTALGHGSNHSINDIVYVLPGKFKVQHTRAIAREISKLNDQLLRAGRKYILIGPGRWGSADPLLGIPVQWQDISNVGLIIELKNDQLRVDPSQGTHFFQNITSLGIQYFHIDEKPRGGQKLDRAWLDEQPTISALKYVVHKRCRKQLNIKVDGKKSLGVVLPQ